MEKDQDDLLETSRANWMLLYFIRGPILLFIKFSEFFERQLFWFGLYEISFWQRSNFSENARWSFLWENFIIRSYWMSELRSIINKSNEIYKDW